MNQLQPVILRNGDCKTQNLAQINKIDNLLYFLRPGGIRIPVKVEIYKHGGGLYMAFTNHEKGVHLPLLANASAMATELRQALNLIETAMATKDHGHISRSQDLATEEGDSPKAATVTERRHELSQFILSKEFIRKSKEKKLELLIEYFSSNSEAMSDDDMSGLVMDLTDSYRKLTGRRYEVIAQSESQLEQDLRILKRHIEKIITDGGELGRGWQSRIAEYLNLPGTGGSHRRRIFNTGHALREFYLSTTENEAENEAEMQNRRVVGE